MSLAESQQFFYELCADPKTMPRLRRNRKTTLAGYFKRDSDINELARYPLERFQTYRNHVSIGVLGSLAMAFPILRSFVTQKEWNELLNDFI